MLESIDNTKSSDIFLSEYFFDIIKNDIASMNINKLIQLAAIDIQEQVNSAVAEKLSIIIE